MSVRSTPLPPCSGSHSRCRWSWLQPGSPGSPTPKVNWPWPVRRSEPRSPMRCRRWGPGPSRSSPRPEPPDSGSRSMCGGTEAWYPTSCSEPPPPATRHCASRSTPSGSASASAIARRGFTLPPKLGPSTLFDGIVHPGWTWQFLTSEPILFANVVGRRGRRRGRGDHTGRVRRTAVRSVALLEGRRMAARDLERADRDQRNTNGGRRSHRRRRRSGSDRHIQPWRSTARLRPHSPRSTP